MSTLASNLRYSPKEIPKFGLKSELPVPPEVIVKKKEKPTAWFKEESEPSKNQTKRVMQQPFGKTARDHDEQKPVGEPRKRSNTTKAMKSLSTTQQTVTFDGFTIKGKLDDNNLSYHPILLEAVRLLNDLKTFALMAIGALYYKQRFLSSKRSYSRANPRKWWSRLL
jgi:hypothetical protein